VLGREVQDVEKQVPFWLVSESQRNVKMNLEAIDANCRKPVDEKR
jgi:hypothetical protein